MKPYLFYILLLFPFGMCFSQIQTEGEMNNGNMNNNSNSIPTEELEIQNIENKNLLEVEEISAPSSPARIQPIVSAKKGEVQSSFKTLNATYLNQYKMFKLKRSEKSLNTSEKDAMENTLRDLVSSSPESFESYLYYYINGENDLTRSKALLKAKEMKPNDAMVQKELLTYYVLLNKTDETRKATLNISKNKLYSKDVESYGEDLVISAPQNATIITHGQEDSYAALYATVVKRERTDVEILSLDWLTSPQYRANLKSKGWNLPSTDFVDTEYLAKLCAMNPNKVIAVSMTLPKEYLMPILDKLFVSGLVFQYLEIPTDLSIQNTTLWNDKMNKKLVESKSHGLVNNYLPMLYQMKKTAQSNGESEGLKEIEQTILEIQNK